MGLVQVEQQQAEEKNLWKLAEVQQADAFQLAIMMRYAKEILLYGPCWRLINASRRNRFFNPVKGSENGSARREESAQPAIRAAAPTAAISRKATLEDIT